MLQTNNYLKSHRNKSLVECGCDEAGRGCLAGPVFAAAVILPRGYKLKGLNDSKQLNAEQRLYLRERIEADSLSFAVARLSNIHIDKYNILRAAIKAMHKAIDGLNMRPQHILVDGNRFNPYQDIPFTCIIKGDGIYASIAAASILAKTYRDEYMEKLHHTYPMYNWTSNKGYPTTDHRRAIAEHGSCKFHRMTFKLLPDPIQPSLFDQ